MVIISPRNLSCCLQRWQRVWWCMNVWCFSLFVNNNAESTQPWVCHKTAISPLFCLLSHSSYSCSSTHLLSGKAHVVPHVRENSGLNEEALQAQSFASTLQLGSFADAALDELQHAALLLPTDLQRRRDTVFKGSTRWRLKKKKKDFGNKEKNWGEKKELCSDEAPAEGWDVSL